MAIADALPAHSLFCVDSFAFIYVLDILQNYGSGNVGPGPGFRGSEFAGPPPLRGGFRGPGGPPCYDYGGPPTYQNRKSGGGGGGYQINR